MKKTVPVWVNILLLLSPIILGILCLGIGRYSLSVGDTIRILFSPLTGVEVAGAEYSVIFGTRLPRIILAIFVGAGLSVSGAAFQALFNNPLATPDTLGVASGTSFGAGLAMLFSLNMISVQSIGLFFGLVALGLTYTISKINGKTSILMVVLSGMVITSFFQALLSLIKYVADPNQALPAITYFLMGSLSGVSADRLAIGLPFIAIGVLVIFLLRWRLNILALNEDEAVSLAVNVTTLRGVVMVAATLITAACVALCGQVGWVGLLVPHITRMIYGNNNTKVVPYSIVIGSSFMLIVDTIARSATAAEIPISVLTAIIGAPIFIVLLKKTRGKL